MKKLITVIIPCYNHGEYLLEAIESVFKNDLENI
jgi:glycosyltransferase involved in cell wall biosynthesis